MKLVKFNPIAKFGEALPNGRAVFVYVDEGERIGLEFVNAEGDRTRAVLSSEAAAVLQKALSAATAIRMTLARSDDHMEWRIVQHQFEVEEQADD